MKKNPKNDRAQPEFRSTIIIYIMIVAILFAASAIKIWGPRLAKDPSPSDDSSADVGKMYEDLMTRVVATNVCPGVTPVHIFREVGDQKYLHATGGRLDADGSIITCGHAFWDIPGKRRAPQKFYYQVLQPRENVFHPINRLVVIEKTGADAVSPSRDVMACIPGPAEPIAPVSPPQEAFIGEKIKFSFSSVVGKPQVVRSTLTGESARLIGYAKLSGGPVYCVLDCGTFQTQSGTMYVNSDNSQAYIVSRSMKLDGEMRKALRLADYYSGATLCSAVSFH